MALETGQKGIEVSAGELPFERRSDLLVVLLEAQQAIFDVGKRGKVIRAEHLALDDGEVDFDLVEPTGMHRAMHRDDVAEGGLQTTDAGTATVRGAVVHGPEDATSGLVWRLAHYVGDQFLEGLLSQRHMVLSLMVATSPLRSTSRAMSPRLKRDSGSPRFVGSSQAMALTSTTTSGGKNSGPPRALEFLQTRQTSLEEAPTPLTHDVTSDIEPGGDLVVAESFGGKENHLGAHHIKIWQRIFPGPLGENPSFLGTQRDVEWAPPRHPLPLR